jgi:hypothetical protein
MARVNLTPTSKLAGDPDTRALPICGRPRVGGDGAGPVLRGEIGREGFAREGLRHLFIPASKLAGDPDTR